MNIKEITHCTLLSLFIFCNLPADLPIGTTHTSKAVTIQNDGKIVVAGFANICNVQQIFLARYDTNGTLDTTFNTTGYVTDPLGTVSEATSVTIQPVDNNIVITGYSDTMLLVQRYTPSGTLDTTFSSDGIITEPINIQTIGHSIRMQSTNILIGGETTNNTTEFLLTRYDSSGTLDTTFGTSGITTTAIGDGATVNGLGFQSDGKIIAAGSAILNGTPAFALARYSANGILDATFGTAGITTTILSGTVSSEISNVVIDASDRIIVAGKAVMNGIPWFTIARYTPSGTLDATFGTSSGYTVIATNGQATNVALQSDGKIIATGFSESEIIIARFDVNGIPDATFGSGGTRVTQAGTDMSGAYGLALQINDQAVIAGFADDLNMVARYTTGGVLDETFGSAGITSEPLPSIIVACT